MPRVQRDRRPIRSIRGSLHSDLAGRLPVFPVQGRNKGELAVLVPCRTTEREADECPTACRRSLAGSFAAQARGLHQTSSRHAARRARYDARPASNNGCCHPPLYIRLPRRGKLALRRIKGDELLTYAHTLRTRRLAGRSSCCSRRVAVQGSLSIAIIQTLHKSTRTVWRMQPISLCWTLVAL